MLESDQNAVAIYLIDVLLVPILTRRAGHLMPLYALQALRRSFR